jgi:hypothetical protein
MTKYFNVRIPHRNFVITSDFGRVLLPSLDIKKEVQNEPLS